MFAPRPVGNKERGRGSVEVVESLYQFSIGVSVTRFIRVRVTVELDVKKSSYGAISDCRMDEKEKDKARITATA